MRNFGHLFARSFMAALCGVIILSGAQAARAQIVIEPTPTPTRSPGPTPTPDPPVKVINADEPARNAVRIIGTSAVSANEDFDSQLFYTVPAGKRLVIEYVSGSAYGKVMPFVGLVTIFGNESAVVHRFEQQNQGFAHAGTGLRQYNTDSMTKIYVESGTKIRLQILRPDGSDGALQAVLRLYGYLIEL